MEYTCAVLKTERRVTGATVWEKVVNVYCSLAGRPHSSIKESGNTPAEMNFTIHFCGSVYLSLKHVHERMADFETRLSTSYSFECSRISSAFRDRKNRRNDHIRSYSDASPRKLQAVWLFCRRGCRFTSGSGRRIFDGQGQLL